MRSQTRKIDGFFRNLDPHSSRLSSQEECWLVAGICIIWKLMEYKNDPSPDACIIPTFQNNFLWEFFMGIFYGFFKWENCI